MKAELQDALYRRYPLLFAQRHLSPSESGMAWGIECGDGWYQLIDGLCEVLVQAGECAATAAQVKQKFGGLRFYLDDGCDRFEGAIRLASAMSHYVCEETGRPGILMARGRSVRTLATDVGQMHGYRPYEPGSSDADAETSAAVEITSLPPGWRRIATVLKGLVAEEPPFAVVQLGYAERGLSVGVLNATDWAAWAAACAVALSNRTDAATGAMQPPTRGHEPPIARVPIARSSKPR